MLAEDARSVVDRAGVERADVLGHSMGGYVAQALALRYPERVRSLVLFGTAAGGPDAAPVPEETLSAWMDAAGLPPEEYARRTWLYSFAPGWTDEHPDEFEELLAARLEFPTPPEAWRAQFDAATRFLQDGAAVEAISARTLVLHGDADRVVPVDNAHELARRIPNAALVVLPGRGHVANLEAPEEFNSVVLDFLA
jgi:pimeloyl-ACP methyl ester carboxylesterase